MNSPGYFEIQADEPQRAITFYSAVFAWRFEEVPGLPVQYWQIHTEGTDGGLLKRPAPAPPPQSGTNAFVCSMQVADFDKSQETILSAGGLVAFPKFAVPGKCWQGYFIDTEGNTFGIFQVDLGAGR